MDERNSVTYVEKILLPMVIFLKTLTSWYVTPFWIFGLGLVLGQPLINCIVLSALFGIIAHRVWS